MARQRTGCIPGSALASRYSLPAGRPSDPYEAHPMSALVPIAGGICAGQSTARPTPDFIVSGTEQPAPSFSLAGQPDALVINPTNVDNHSHLHNNANNSC